MCIDATFLAAVRYYPFYSLSFNYLVMHLSLILKKKVMRNVLRKSSNMSVGQTVLCIALFLIIGYIGGVKEADRKREEPHEAYVTHIMPYAGGFETAYEPGSDGWLHDLTRHYVPNASDEWVEDYLFMNNDQYYDKYGTYRFDIPYWEHADDGYAYE